MSLTRAEKAAGRAFRDAQEHALAQRNLDSPPGIAVLSVQHHYRHECSARGGQSVSFELREVYIRSPELWADDSAVLGAAEGRFAWIYKEGRCADCGVTARSRDGRLVVAEERPPLRR